MSSLKQWISAILNYFLSLYNTFSVVKENTRVTVKLYFIGHTRRFNYSLLRPRLSEEKLFQPRQLQQAASICEKRWPWCPSQHGARACSDCLKQRSHMLWFSRLDRLDPAGRTKVLYEEKLAQLGECTTIEKAYPARLVTLLAKPTFYFSC